MGFAGSTQPQYIIPSYVGVKETVKGGIGNKILSDLDYAIGDEIYANANLTQKSPMKSGLISDFNLYEKLMNCAIHSYLSVDPANHIFFLTEPPLNTPENREFLAELMFENFRVQGMYIGVQAVMALTASWVGRHPQDRPTTGIVVDSGHGLTHIIPVADSYAIGTAMKYMPIAGTEMTSFTNQLIRERESHVPSECLHDIAKTVKEQHCYSCKNLVSEFSKLESSPDKIIRRYKGAHNVTKLPFEFDMSYERFMAPELFFSPDIYNSEHVKSLDRLVFDSVFDCPVDVRRGLLKNVVLSGGSTIYPNLSRRIEQELKKRTSERISVGSALEVNVISHSKQEYAVFFGCSMMASMPEFRSVIHTREEYQENGPSICRHNQIFGSLA